MPHRQNDLPLAGDPTDHLGPARDAMGEANELVEDQRNHGDGKPTLAAIDRLTDAVSAYLAVVRRVERRKALEALARADADLL